MSRLACSFLAVSLLLGALPACSKDEKPKPTTDEGNKSTIPVPSDVVFNDFLQPNGAQGKVSVRGDGGLEAGIAAEMGAGGDGGGASSPSAAAAADEAPDTDPNGKLKITDPGAEPRSARKYVFVVGKTDKRLLTIRNSAVAEAGQPAQQIALALTVDFTPKAVKPEGTHFEMKVTAIDLPDIQGPDRAAASQQFASLKGFVMGFDVSARGEVGELSIEGADQRLQSRPGQMVATFLQESLPFVIVPLPEGPIGVGAKWEQNVQSLDRGAQQTSKHRFQMKDLTADGAATMTSDIEQQLNVSQRGVVQLSSIKGGYTYAIRFDHIATKVDGELNITQHVEQTDPRTGQKMAQDQKVKLKNTIEVAK